MKHYYSDLNYTRHRKSKVESSHHKVLPLPIPTDASQQTFQGIFLRLFLNSVPSVIYVWSCKHLEILFPTFLNSLKVQNYISTTDQIHHRRQKDISMDFSFSIQHFVLICSYTILTNMETFHIFIMWRGIYHLFQIYSVISLLGQYLRDWQLNFLLQQLPFLPPSCLFSYFFSIHFNKHKH